MSTYNYPPVAGAFGETRVPHEGPGGLNCLPVEGILGIPRGRLGSRGPLRVHNPGNSSQSERRFFFQAQHVDTIFL